MSKNKCPHCKKPVRIKNNPYRPFCSERCKLVDLDAWLSGRYYIKSEDKVKKTEGAEENKNE